jgi:hypothetical protein
MESWVLPDAIATPSTDDVGTAATESKWAPSDTPPDASAALSGRRARAVEAYCAALCPPAEASAAAAETLGSFKGGDDQSLLEHTRTVTTRYISAAPEAHRSWRRVRSAERERDCERTPSVLAALANGELGDGERQALDDHIRGCVLCQALEQRSHRAERSFAAITGIGAVTTAAVAAPDTAQTEAPAEAAAAAGLASEWLPTANPAMDTVAPAEAAAAASVGSSAAPAEAAAAASVGAEWLPTTNPAMDTAVTPPVAAEVAPAPSRPRRRRTGMLAAVAAVAVAAAVAIALVIGGSSTKNKPIANVSSTPSPTTKIATPAPRHKPKPAASRHRSRRTAVRVKHAAKPASRPATVAAAPVTAVAPAVSSPVPVAPSSPATSAPSSPTPSAPITQAPSSASSAPSATISQPSLGAASAPQGLGSGHTP